jgi:uncharacterized protein (DUF488 family)
MAHGELPELFTVGHSNHPLDTFLELLDQHAITAIADVRSQPFSRYTPQYNRDDLERVLKRRGLSYVFLGEELGARRSEPECYRGGKVSFERAAKSELFQRGVERLRRGTDRHRIALMCAEKDPLDCHRSILLARNIKSRFLIRHILETGQLELQEQLEQRLLIAHKLAGQELFRTEEERIDDAYASQAGRIAYAPDEVADSVRENGIP